MAILQANDSNFDELVLQSDKPVLVDFFATWCGPCKMLSPILEDMSKSSDYTIVKVDIDENPYLVREWEVASVPTLFIVKNGEKKEKMIGFQPPSAAGQISRAAPESFFRERRVFSSRFLKFPGFCDLTEKSSGNIIVHNLC